MRILLGCFWVVEKGRQRETTHSRQAKIRGHGSVPADGELPEGKEHEDRFNGRSPNVFRGSPHVLFV